MRQKNGFDQFPEFKSKGIEFEVGDKYLFRQLTGLLICQSLVHQNPLRDNVMKDVYFLNTGRRSRKIDQVEEMKI
jgi:hypothetical protein